MAQAYINERTVDYHSLKSRFLARSSRPSAEQFDALNLHLRHGLVTPGQMVIVPDDYAVACTLNDAWLMRQAQEIRRGLELNSAAGIAVINNYDLLQSLLGYSSLGVGPGVRLGRGIWMRSGIRWRKSSACIGNSRVGRWIGRCLFASARGCSSAWKLN